MAATTPIWKPSSLQREYRTVLDRAKVTPQVILDADQELLVIERKADADFLASLHRHMTQLARFTRAHAANRGLPPAQWAAQTDFPYIATLSPDEVDDFERELLAYILDAAQRGTTDALEGNLRAWESTAATYEDPESLAAMTADIDMTAAVEVFPPPESAESD